MPLSRICRKLAVPLALAGAYLATRLPGLASSLPIFVDEAIYMIWGQRLLGEARWHRSAVSGKLLSIVMTGLALKLPGDPLWAARLSSVIAGAVTLAACYFAGLRLGGRVAAAVAGALCVLSPLALLHDRLCLADNWLAAASALVVLGSARLATQPGRWTALGTSLALAAAVLAKTTGVLALAIPVLAAVALPRRPGIWRALLWTCLPAGAVTATCLLLYAPGPELTAHSALGGAVSLPRNLALGAQWMWSYWTGALLLAFVVAFLFLVRRRRDVALWLAACSALPFVFYVVTARWWAPRYLLVTVGPMALLAATAAAEAWRCTPWRRRWALVLPLALPALLFDVRLLVNPSTAPLPAIDRTQYLDGWTAGRGARQAAAWLQAQARSGSVLVLAHAAAARINAPARQLRALCLGAHDITITETNLSLPTAPPLPGVANRPAVFLLVRPEDRAAPWFAALAARTQRLSWGAPPPFPNLYALESEPAPPRVSARQAAPSGPARARRRT